AEGERRASDVYVEEELEQERLETEPVEDALSARGFVRVSANMTTAGEWTPREALAGLHAREARPDEHALWSALYSEGFGRTGRDAQLDLARWELSFGSASVKHWFFVRGEGEEEVGVCQTCEAGGVIGIYSFTLAGASRGSRTLIAAIRALRARLTESGNVTVYFERAKRKRARLPHHPVSPRLTPDFKIIRVTTGYRRLLDRH
ncbi:MAG TPA: hypothetical protein VFX96_17355, partial [Pyrinomonadaceae bacterium]|nr:hypothetical protein [Pyrinomonadaceae bacterium]